MAPDKSRVELPRRHIPDTLPRQGQIVHEASGSSSGQVRRPGPSESSKAISGMIRSLKDLAMGGNRRAQDAFLLSLLSRIVSGFGFSGLLNARIRSPVSAGAWTL